jgi:hypothetical protein
MSTEYGEKVALAVRAVSQLHSDTSRLLVDFDNKRLGTGWKPMFGNVVTSGISTTITAQWWMAESVYRYYVKSSAPELAEGLLVSFFHPQQKSKEPLLVVAQIKYLVFAGSLIKDVCKAWDTWNLFYEWNEQQALEKIISIGHQDNGRIEWANILAVPLYSIKSVEAVELLMAQVRGSGSA